MLALCSMLMPPKFVPIILKLCQHNWSKPSGEPTWRTLVEALRKGGQEGTARDIEEKESRSNRITLKHPQ